MRIGQQGVVGNGIPAVDAGEVENFGEQGKIGAESALPEIEPENGATIVLGPF